MESPENSYKYYYLKDHAANVPFKDPVIWKDSVGISHIINTSDNLNKNYKPRQNLDKNKGRTREGKLKKLTIILSIAFAVLTIILNIVYPLA